ncbi:MAG: sugar ABC transporter permease [Caldilinea sp. CFX5]|nr:sugar ABC transporter permease [Caldilinea sp. CFX5]
MANVFVRATPAGKVTRKPTRLRVIEARYGWLFAAPWLIGFLVFTLGPMVASALMTFAEWSILKPPQFIGMQNYTKLVNDPLIWHSFKLTTFYAVGYVPLNTMLGLFLAVLLNQRISLLRFYRTAYYMPSVLSGVAVAVMWRLILSADFGLLNYLLSLVGIQGPAWLSDPRWVLPAFIIMALWHFGGSVVIYLAGLQGIPTDLYEAAAVDGAGWWRKLRSITLPLLTPIIFFQLIIGTINALQTFTQAFIMTKGGPMNASLFIVLYLYQKAFESFQMGYASLIAWCLFVYILLLTLILIRTSGRWVYYEGQIKV